MTTQRVVNNGVTQADWRKRPSSAAGTDAERVAADSSYDRYTPSQAAEAQSKTTLTGILEKLGLSLSTANVKDRRMASAAGVVPGAAPEPVADPLAVVAESETPTVKGLTDVISDLDKKIADYQAAAKAATDPASSKNLEALQTVIADLTTAKDKLVAIKEALTKLGDGQQTAYDSKIDLIKAQVALVQSELDFYSAREVDLAGLSQAAKNTTNELSAKLDNLKDDIDTIDVRAFWAPYVAASAFEDGVVTLNEIKDPTAQKTVAKFIDAYKVDVRSVVEKGVKVSGLTATQLGEIKDLYAAHVEMVLGAQFSLDPTNANQKEFMTNVFKLALEGKFNLQELKALAVGPKSLLKVKEKDFDMTQQAFNAFYATKMNGDELNLDLVDLIQGTANLEYTASTAFDRRAGNMSIKDKIEAFVAQNMDKKNFYLIDCDSVSLALEDSIKMLINVKKEEHVSREELLKRLKELADNGKLNNEFSEKIKKVTELSWDDLVEYVLQSVDQAIVKNSKDGFSTPKQMVAEIRIMNTYEAISDSKKGKGAVDALGIELRDFFATGDAIDWERIRNAEPDKRGIASVGGTVAGVN